MPSMKTFKAKVNQLLNIKFPDPKMQREFNGLKSQNGMRDFHVPLSLLFPYLIVNRLQCYF